jgi:uncharacterized membrane protein YesL
VTSSESVGLLPAGSGRTVGQLPAVLVVPGVLVTLNVCALVAALPVVTSAAAVVALQATLHAWREQDEQHLVRRFLWELRLQLPRLVPLGVVLAVALVGLIVSLAFWLGAGLPLGAAALAFELPLVLAAMAWLLAVQEVAGLRPGEPPRAWIMRSLGVLVAHPVRAGAGVIGLLGWVLMENQAPPLALAGGLVIPALIAHWVYHETAVQRWDLDLGDGDD